jgi:hypothetical protein
MASTQNRLLQTFFEAAGLEWPVHQTLLTDGEQLTKSLTANQSAIGSQITDNAPTTGGGSTLPSIASSVFKSGLGLAPLVSGLLGLFGGGGSPEPEALLKYALPSAIDFAGAYSGSGIRELDYDQRGVARSFRPSEPNGVQSMPMAAPGAPDSPQTAAPQITVNVQAMDSRSFLDHSGDIAQAVREAMLHLNSINDVVSEL